MTTTLTERMAEAVARAEEHETPLVAKYVASMAYDARLGLFCYAPFTFAGRVRFNLTGTSGRPWQRAAEVVMAHLTQAEVCQIEGAA
jgi:hypothetical protein